MMLCAMLQLQDDEAWRHLDMVVRNLTPLPPASVVAFRLGFALLGRYDNDGHAQNKVAVKRLKMAPIHQHLPVLSEPKSNLYGFDSFPLVG
jgi:hypothetical protein